MFGNLKYIVDEFDNFMVFSPSIHHKTANRSCEAHNYGSCVGAGFICMSDGEVSCFGYSESLRIRSRGEIDATIIANAMKLKIHKA